MKYLILLFLIEITFATSLKSQVTIEPSSLTLGIETVGQVVEDTILYWRKSHGAMRGGLFKTGNILSNNTGAFSFAYGSENIARGNSSIALGAENETEKYAGIAIGRSNNSVGAESISIGSHNEVNGDGGVALGSDLIVNNSNTIAVGISNADIPVKSDANRLLKPIFVVGNGDKTSGRSNAITVILDGRTGINTEEPQSDLHLVHKDNSAHAGLRIENRVPNSNDENNWWRLYTKSQSDELSLHNNNFSGGTSAVGQFNSSGAYSSNSDRRLKKDIIDLPYGLEEVLMLSAKRYQFKHVSDRLDIGLIAQDVLEIIPELVSYHEEEDKYMMNYDGFGVLAIKAIQELSEIVKKQQVLIDKLIEENKK